MGVALWVLIFLIIAGFGGVLYFLNKKFVELRRVQEENEAQKVLMEWLKGMRESVDKSRDTVENRLDKTNQAINERLDNAARVIGEVKRELGKMSEVGQKMEELRSFLLSPKLRGNVGEHFLYDLLKQRIPQKHLFLQHQFKNGQIVDAVIETSGGLIPIDSKFPKENFNKMMETKNQEDEERLRKAFVKDVKKHVDDIAKKYIMPEEGTVNFALMYVPSEPVAYEIVARMPELADYAYEKKVAIVSPNQFNHFLNVVMIGFERQQVSERAKYILDSLRAIERETRHFGEDLGVLIKHVTNAKSKADEVGSGFTQLQGKIQLVKRLESPASEDSGEGTQKLLAPEGGD